MAYVSTPIVFSGSADAGQLQIKPADVYVGRLDSVTHEITGSKYIGYTNQQLTLSITQEEAEYKQNGVPVKSVPISKMAEATFRLDQWDTDTFAWALGVADKLVDAANGKKRVIISADNITPEDWYIIFKTETVGGKPVEFHIPHGNVNIDGDLTFGGGNDSPNFGGITVRVKALAATINGAGGTEEALAFYQYDYTNVAVTGVEGLPDTMAISVGEKVSLNAIVAPASATDQRVTWASDDATKATVSSTGLVTGIAAGTADITVTTVDGSFDDTCTVTVS